MATRMSALLSAAAMMLFTLANRTGCGLSAIWASDSCGYSSNATDGYKFASVLTAVEMPLVVVVVVVTVDEVILLATRYFSVVHGQMTTSSWSCPHMLAPFL